MLVTVQWLPRQRSTFCVEDDLVLSDLLAHALRRADLTLDVTGEVVEAKRLLARVAYKVLVLDVFLPDGTGFDILSFIKTEKIGRLQIVVLTAADPSMLERIDRSLVKTVTFKPIDIEQFATSVRTLAGNQPSRP